MSGGAAVSYGSKRQHCISLSSAEAEIVAASHTAAEVIYLRDLLAEVGREEARATQMYVDNLGAVELSKEWRSCQRSRHVDRRDLKVREYVAHCNIEMRKIGTDDNVAEVFTKSLLANAHHKHVNSARSISPRALFNPAACRPRSHRPLHSNCIRSYSRREFPSEGGLYDSDFNPFSKTNLRVRTRSCAIARQSHRVVRVHARERELEWTLALDVAKGCCEGDELLLRVDEGGEGQA
eukprot:3384572-Pleurochrysis_carterae.AAC.1